MEIAVFNYIAHIFNSAKSSADLKIHMLESTELCYMVPDCNSGRIAFPHLDIDVVYF